MCYKINLLVIIGSIDSRLARSVWKLKNLLLSADSVKGRAPPAIYFRSWASRVYLRVKALSDCRVVYSAEVVCTLYGVNMQVNSRVTTLTLTHFGCMFCSYGFNQYIFSPTTRHSAPSKINGYFVTKSAYRLRFAVSADRPTFVSAETWLTFADEFAHAGFAFPSAEPFKTPTTN